jgi:hypothetical protein
MKAIRTLIEKSTLRNPVRMRQAVGRGALIGLRWANFIARIGAAIILAFAFALIGYAIIQNWPASLRDFADPRIQKPLLKFFLATAGFYVSTCGWGVVIGGVVGAVVFGLRRPPLG